MRIGVLTLQGDFAEHLRALNRCEVEAVGIKRPEQLKAVDGLILPGGESTTIGMLMERFGLDEPVRQRASEGMPIWGTCAGMILLAKDIVNYSGNRLGLMDIRVKRNAFGRQVDSFETDLTIEGLPGGPFHAVFIRAPLVESVGAHCRVLARFEESIVAVQQGKILASAFHPELTDDLRLHQYFLRLCAESKA